MYNGTFHTCWVWDDTWDVRSSQDINPNPRGRPVTPDGGMLLLLKDFRSLGFGTPPKFDTRPLTNKIALPFTESKSGLSLADYQNRLMALELQNKRRLLRGIAEANASGETPGSIMVPSESSRERSTPLLAHL
jgi:hypothetical protein